MGGVTRPYDKDMFRHAVLQRNICLIICSIVPLLTLGENVVKFSMFSKTVFFPRSHSTQTLAEWNDLENDHVQGFFFYIDSLFLL